MPEYNNSSTSFLSDNNDKANEFKQEQQKDTAFTVSGLSFFFFYSFLYSLFSLLLVFMENTEFTLCCVVDGV